MLSLLSAPMNYRQVKTVILLFTIGHSIYVYKDKRKQTEESELCEYVKLNNCHLLS